MLNEEQRTAAQQKLKNHTNKSIDDFIVKHPSLNDELKQAAGYMLCDTSLLMIVALGGQNGLCLLHDGTSDTILDLNSVNISVGLSSTHSQFLALFKSTQTLNDVKNGHFTVQLESLSKAGQQRNTHAQQYAQQIAIYSLNNEGSVASLEVGMLSLTVNK